LAAACTPAFFLAVNMPILIQFASLISTPLLEYLSPPLSTDIRPSPTAMRLHLLPPQLDLEVTAAGMVEDSLVRGGQAQFFRQQPLKETEILGKVPGGSFFLFNI